MLAEEFNKMAENLQPGLQPAWSKKLQREPRSLLLPTRDLKDSIDLKSDFVSHVSHELRTPLTAIKGAVDLILREVSGPLNEKQTHYLTRVRSNTQHLPRIDQRSFGPLKDRGGKNRGQIDAFLSAVLVHEVVETLRPVAAEKEITLRRTVPEASILVWADRDKLTSFDEP